MGLVKKLAPLILGSFVFGNLFYGNVSAQEIENTKERMPKIMGEIIDIEESISKDGKIEIKEKLFQLNKYSFLDVFYLKCGGISEKLPFSVLIIDKRNPFKDSVLYLDQDRDDFIDVPGKITGKDLLKHNMFKDAPKCKYISPPSLPEDYFDNLPTGVFPPAA